MELLNQLFNSLILIIRCYIDSYIILIFGFTHFRLHYIPILYLCMVMCGSIFCIYSNEKQTLQANILFSDAFQKVSILAKEVFPSKQI